MRDKIHTDDTSPTNRICLPIQPPKNRKKIKSKLLFALTIAVALLKSATVFGQAPTLGSAANFVIFTGVGAVTHTGSSLITGNVGSNSGAGTGFGNVNGVMHSGDATTASCNADLATAYNQLNAATPTAVLASPIGNGNTYTAGVYHVTSAAALNLNLILDGQGNANAVFIFQVDGSFSTNALSSVTLINGALACNVFWKIEGQVNMATGTTMRGTIIAHNAAITMGSGDTLEGRVLSTNGAISVSGIFAYTPIGCGSTYLTGPTAPTLVATAAYEILSGNGPVTNTGITYVVGDVGTNVGLTTGFNPLLVQGTIHSIPDASTAAAATDLTTVYNYLNGLPTDIELLYPAQFGNGLILTPHTYLMNAATTFTGTVNLDAENNANAVFVIKVNGAFSTSTFSRVALLNGAQAKNVYWEINGAVNINNNSVFNGNIIANNGAITTGTGDTVTGRLFTTDGAIGVSNGYFGAPISCTAPPIAGANHVCIGQSTTLTDSTTGGTWSSSNPLIATINPTTGVATGITAGIDTITYVTTAGCTNTLQFTVNSLPAPIVGLSTVCAGATITLTDISPNGTWSSNNLLSATVTNGTGVVTGVNAGTATISYTLTTGCSATKNIVVNPLPNAGTITGPTSVCTGATITLTDAAAGGIWSASNANATVVNGLVTGVLTGTDNIIYTVTNTCGTATATHAITINTVPGAGTITGPNSVCVGSTITLTDAVTGGIWSAANSNATVLNGVASGVTAGTDNITYSVTNVCGTTTANDLITINPLPTAGSITGPSSVCVGATVTLTDATTGGTWSASNTNATVLNGVVTGSAPGTDNIMYSVTNVCGTAIATHAMTINPLPNAGTISGPTSVCVGSSITLTDATTGGTWSAGNNNATVLNGVVSGVTAGTDNIIYSVTNVCGTATTTQTIIINPLPNAGTITGPTGVCYGASIILTDVATGGTWSTSNNNASVAGGTVTANTTGQDTIYYTVVNVCGTAIASQDITVNPLPIVPAITTQAPANVCTDTKYQNFGTATPPPTGTTYNWTATNAKVWAQGLGRQYSLVTFDTTGNAYVMLHATLTGTGCTNETTIPITVGTSIAEIPSVVYFNYHFVCTPNNENSYQWGYDDAVTLDSTILTGEINQDYLNTNADFANKYYWVMNNIGGCLQKTYYTIPTSVQNVNSAAGLSVYPNPTSSVVNIIISSAISGEMQVEIMNMTGQRISMTTAPNNKASINVEMLPAGSYLVTCYRDGMKIAISKFTKN